VSKQSADEHGCGKHDDRRDQSPKNDHHSRCPSSQRALRFAQVRRASDQRFGNQAALEAERNEVEGEADYDGGET
jgi:hypothetical protein